jgi:uncharacterized membrane protein
MRRQLFWLLTAAVLGLCAHVAYVLFVPSRSFSAAIDAALGGQKANSFAVLDSASQLKLMPFVAKHHLVGACKFDLSQGPIKFSAQLPEGFWSFAVYTIRGRQVYAINDTQADTNSFSVELSREGGLLAQILGGAEDAQDIDGDELGWRIAMTDAQGLAILWMAVADPLLRQEALEVMQKSRCLRLDG